MPDNKWRLIKPVESSNYVLNPSAEIAGNFSALVGAAVSRSTAYQKYGLYSYYVDVAAANDGVRLTLSALTNTEHFVSLRIRHPFPDPLYATIGTTTKQLRFIEKIDGNWDLYGTGFAASEANGATALDITAGSVVDFYIDGIQVEPLNYVTTYVDGTQPGCEWLGTVHGSISQRSGESRAGGRPVDFYDEYGFLIQKIVGAGSAPKTLGVDSYALLPGGELNSVKVNTRDWTIIGKFYAETEEKLHENIQALDTELQNSSYYGSQPILIRFNGARVQKEIAIHYRGGLEGDLAAYYDGCYEQDREQWIKVDKWTTDATIQFQSPNPYWYEIGESAALLDTEDSATFRNVAARLRSTGQWDDLGPPNAAGGPYQGVRAMAEDDNYIYMVGNFDDFDNIANADNAVRYDKQAGTYSAMGTGLNQTAYDVIVGSDGLIYVGGAFTTAGGGAANYIASWNPGTSTWAALGAGTDNTVNDLTVGLDGLIYVGGQFANAGGAPAAEIASWNPDTSAWAALGVGTDNTVLALATGIDGLIYVGGSFLNAGGAAARYIASWNPTTSAWSALADGFTGGAAPRVDTIAIGSDGRAYAGGLFTSSGSLTVNNVAVWNGTAWSDMNGGANEQVFHLAMAPDDELYAVGNFSSIGGITLTDRIARWNGSTWAHVDIDFSATPFLYFVHHGQPDPVVPTLYDVWVGFTPTPTGDYGGLVTVDNEGTVWAYPKITFNRSGGTGATIATLSNERTGRELLFDYALMDGETLTITLEPTQRSVVSSVFGSRPDAILTNSDFGSWKLLPGNNDVTSFVIEGGAVTVTAWMLWRSAFDSYN